MYQETDIKVEINNFLSKYFPITTNSNLIAIRNTLEEQILFKTRENISNGFSNHKAVEYAIEETVDINEMKTLIRSIRIQKIKSIFFSYFSLIALFTFVYPVGLYFYLGSQEITFIYILPAIIGMCLLVAKAYSIFAEMFW